MRVRWALEEVGQPYRVRLVSFSEMKQASHRALNPFGQIPTFEDGCLALFETGSIVLHIAERPRRVQRRRPPNGDSPAQVGRIRDPGRLFGPVRLCRARGRAARIQARFRRPACRLHRRLGGLIELLTVEQGPDQPSKIVRGDVRAAVAIAPFSRPSGREPSRARPPPRLCACSAAGLRSSVASRDSRP